MPQITPSTYQLSKETYQGILDKNRSLLYFALSRPRSRARSLSRSLSLYIYICIQNAFSGVLDKKRSTELGIQELSKQLGFAYTIMHVGGMSKESALLGVSIVAGDEQSGRVSSVCAHACLLTHTYSCVCSHTPPTP